jgi:hypothetical protein
LTQTTTYYAQARNTSTSCVSSSRLSVKGTVNAYGAAGSAPGTCGCASGLLNCSGTCKTTCFAFTACPGISEVQVYTSSVTNGEGMANTNSACLSLGTGWRPVGAEAGSCLCENYLRPNADTQTVIGNKSHNEDWEYSQLRYSVKSGCMLTGDKNMKFVRLLCVK